MDKWMIVYNCYSYLTIYIVFFLFQLLKLISADLTIEELLNMSAQQLADATTQQKRQQERSNVLQDAYRGVSTQETIEARNREVMSGAVEAWRTGELDSSLKRSINSSLGSSSSSSSSNEASSSVAAVSSTSPGGTIDVGMTVEMITESGSSKDQSESETSEAKTAASSSHWDTTGLKKTPTSKRPLDVDAMSRFNIHSAHDFPPSIETSSELNEKNNSAKLSRLSEINASQSITMSKESPRNKPPPTLLHSILANQVSSKLAKEKSDSASSATGGSMMSSKKSSSGNEWSSAKLCKLISSAGSYDFSIVRPAHGGNNKSVVLKCQGLIADR